MTDLFTQGQTEQEEVVKASPAQNILTVSELSNSLRMLVEREFGYVAVEGEVSGFKAAASGHIYFDLKDKTNLIKSVVWRSTAGSLKYRPKDGDQVVVYGMLTAYGPRSNYQLIVKRIEPAGAGVLMQRFEELKRQLASEGLFDRGRKRPIPYLPSRIGVVTSSTGAVIEDIKHRIEDRFPTHIQLAEVLVQGVGAKEQIAKAIETLNNLPENTRPEVIIVARGGGSMEDLWAFNEEIVVRAVAASDIPVISAVGHETDITLCDYAADLRAPTPTAAAELALPVKRELQEKLINIKSRLQQSAVGEVRALRKHVMLFRMALPDPQSHLAQAQFKLEDMRNNINRVIHININTTCSKFTIKKQFFNSKNIRNYFDYKIGRYGQLSTRFFARKELIGETRSLLDKKHHSMQQSLYRKYERNLQSLRYMDTRLDCNNILRKKLSSMNEQLIEKEKLLKSYSPLGPLERGYVIVQDAAGMVVRHAQQIAEGEITLKFDDGTRQAKLSKDK